MPTYNRRTTHYSKLKALAKTKDELDPAQLKATRREKLRDFLISLVKAGTAGIAGSFSEILGGFLDPSYKGRHERFLIVLARHIKKLEERDFEIDFEALFSSEEFATAYAIAMQAAIKTQKEEKHERLANALINATLKYSVEQDKASMFLYLLDRFTVTHIKVLELLNDTKQQFYALGLTDLPTLSDLVTKAIPELEDKYEFYWQIARELVEAGMVRPGVTIKQANIATGGADERRLAESETTDFGKEFLKFVSDPLDGIKPLTKE